MRLGIRNRKAIGFAYGWTTFNSNGYVKVVDHRSNDCQLLVVLGAKEGDVRRNQVEKLENDCRDPSKMAGAKSSFQRSSNRWCLHVGRESRGIDS